jgi:heme/copper-type cytochrome/quinol oxidase subunit 4
MNKIRFWVPSIIGVLLTPIFFYASTLTSRGAASHAGGGFQAICFYPLPILLAVVVSSSMDDAFLQQVIRVICIGLAVIQFPFFGFMLSHAGTRQGSIFYALIKGVIWFHVIVSLIFLVIVFILGG